MLSLILIKLKVKILERDIVMTSDGRLMKYCLRLKNIQENIKTSSPYQLNVMALKSVYNIISKAAATGRVKNHSHFQLSDEEMRTRCRLGFDSYANTCYAGRHATVKSFIEGKTVTATGFSSSMPAMENLPLAKVLYALDSAYGEVFIL